jgi:DNA-directed RNA polymerase specialized sigma24 family protein
MADTLEELEALYRARYAAFVRVAHGIVGHEQTARDVVHDAFVLAVRKRDRLRDERAVEPWVWRILVNEAPEAAGA